MLTNVTYYQSCEGLQLVMINKNINFNLLRILSITSLFKSITIVQGYWKSNNHQSIAHYLFRVEIFYIH